MNTYRRYLRAVLFSTVLTLGAVSASAQTPLHECTKLKPSNAGQSFILTTNVVSSPSQTCFEITGNDITLDLNGYAITGAGGGVFAVGVKSDGVTIRNGAIRDVFRAVDITGGVNATVEKMKIHNVTSFAIGGAGIKKGMVIRDNQIVGAGTPIAVGSECTITGNTIRASSTTGSNAFAIAGASDCLIRGNTILDNTGMGGIEATNSAIIENVISGNGGIGIDADQPGTASTNMLILNNIVRGNAGDGIRVDCPALLRGNVVRSNPLVTTGSGCKVIDSLP